MTTFITTFGAAFMLGLVFSAAPGPIFAESIRRGLTGGFDEALRVQLGSLVGDATWAILGLAGVGILLQTDMLKIPIGLAGAGYLGWLAWDSWREAATSGQPPAEPPEDAQKSEGAQESGTKVSGGAFRSGMVLSLSNPQNVAFWAALGSAFGSLGVDTPTTMDYSVFFTGFMVASVAWCYFCAAAISRLFGGRNAAWHVWTYRICALAFAYLACGTAWEALRLLLG